MLHSQLSRVLGLESLDDGQNIPLTAEETSAIEVDFVNSSHELTQEVNSMTEMQRDVSTISSYQELMEKTEEPDVVTVEAIYIGLQNLLVKHSINTDELYPSLEAWDYSPNGSKTISMEKTEELLQGLKNGVKDAAKLIWKKLQEFFAAFKRFFSKIFKFRKEKEIKAAKETLDEMKNGSKAEEVVEQVNQAAGGDNDDTAIKNGTPKGIKRHLKKGAKYVQYFGGSILFNIELDKKDLGEILYISTLDKGTIFQEIYVHHLGGVLMDINVKDKYLMYDNIEENILHYVKTSDGTSVGNNIVIDFTTSKLVWQHEVDDEKKLTDVNLQDVTNLDKVFQKYSNNGSLFASLKNKQALNIMHMEQLLDAQKRILDSLDIIVNFTDKFKHMDIKNPEIASNKVFGVATKGFALSSRDYISRCTLASKLISDLLAPLAEKGGIKVDPTNR